MTLEEAITLQPAWIGYWLNWMLFAALALPAALLIWRQSRIAGAAIIVADVAAAFSTSWLYEQLGYVKLLGLPHVVLWTPVAVYLVLQLRRADMPVWPQRILLVTLATILVSLAFDYTDAARYFLGERAPFPGTAPA